MQINENDELYKCTVNFFFFRISILLLPFLIFSFLAKIEVPFQSSIYHSSICLDKSTVVNLYMLAKFRCLSRFFVHAIHD